MLTVATTQNNQGEQKQVECQPDERDQVDRLRQKNQGLEEREMTAVLRSARVSGLLHRAIREREDDYLFKGVVETGYLYRKMTGVDLQAKDKQALDEMLGYDVHDHLQPTGMWDRKWLIPIVNVLITFITER